VLEEVERWLSTRSWSLTDRPLHQILAAKQRTGQSVSVVLPALNEEETVGDIVAIIRHDLMQQVPLVDEIVVVDSGSTDRTSEVAAAAGARVVHRDDILPRIPTVPGKGEVLWRSLLVTSGDIVCFIDADLKEFSSDFVSGIVGPLLTDPGIDLVKGMYDRPLGGAAGQGGRVTELMAKPLVNLFYPELAGFVQPLAGEFAARREVLSSVPFFTGYGVEIGMLIDVFDQVGLAAMAQVDLGTRQNRHQSLASLSRMSSVVLRTVAAREGLGQRPGKDLHEGVTGLWEQPDTYLHAVATEEGLRLDEHLNELVERPPLASLTDDTALSTIV
jgi:glucosyl-3-phosphoglycerate synthase